SYEQFAENLQKEIEAETGIRFGILEAHHFVAVKVTSASGDMTSLGLEKSKALWEHLRSDGYIDARGKVQESLKQALASGPIRSANNSPRTCRGRSRPRGASGSVSWQRTTLWP